MSFFATTKRDSCTRNFNKKHPKVMGSSNFLPTRTSSFNIHFVSNMSGHHLRTSLPFYFAMLRWGVFFGRTRNKVCWVCLFESYVQTPCAYKDCLPWSFHKMKLWLPMARNTLHKWITRDLANVFSPTTSKPTHLNKINKSNERCLKSMLSDCQACYGYGKKGRLWIPPQDPVEWVDLSRKLIGFIKGS